MTTIFYGTNNAAKVNYLKKVVAGISVDIAGINELPNIDHDINESGKEPLENAKIKALHYYGQIKRPVFSIDSGLFFENIEYEDQPGTLVRRVNGKTLNDEEMIMYYSKLAEKYGGELTGYYKNAMCVIINDKIIIDKNDGKINTERFILSSKAHEKRVAGWPLDSLSKDLTSGKYYYDINRIWDNKQIEEEYIKIFTEAAEKIKKI
jgi:8-oxo-dGTP diphosphatase